MLHTHTHFNKLNNQQCCMHCPILSPTINKKTPQAPSTTANPAWSKHKPAYRFLGRLFLGQGEGARQEPAGTTALGNPATSMHSAQTLVNSRMYCHWHVQGILQQACTLHKPWLTAGCPATGSTLHKPWLTAGCTVTDMYRESCNKHALCTNPG